MIRTFHIVSVYDKNCHAVNMDSNYLTCLFVCWIYFSCDVLFVVLVACFQFYFLFLHYYYSVYCCIYANKDIYYIPVACDRYTINSKLIINPTAI